MKILKIMPALGAFVFVLGCNRSSETSYSSTDTPNNQPRADASLSATSQTNTPSRVYSRDTVDTTRTAETTPAVDTSATVDTSTTAGKDVDNTGKNQRDRSGETLTPGDQGKSESDREVTRNVRKAIVGNDQLSSMAKNIKIITIDGKVTLRGPVKTEQDRSTIASLVQNVAGVTSFDNQLEVKTTNQ